MTCSQNVLLYQATDKIQFEHQSEDADADADVGDDDVDDDGN